MTIQQQIDDAITVEGDYVNRSTDLGGATRWGITEAVARAEGFKGDMRSLPRAFAAGIYLKRYWTDVHFDLVAAIAPKVAAEMFDTGINCGQATAVQLLQRALNAFQGTALKRDGIILPGGASLTTLAAYIAARKAQDGELVLVELLNGLQAERYVELVEARASQRDYIFGWIRNRVLRRAA
jgi:lysozyme family protein